jgi:hypothetical protein
MDADQIREFVGRIDGIWPPKKAPTMEERQEWVSFLRPLDGEVALECIDLMRDCLMWHPSMADVKRYYHEAAAVPRTCLPQLPAGEPSEYKETLADVYGASQDHWIWCWRCDQAISLEDQSIASLWDEQRGLFHRHCPKGGSAPSMPVGLRIARSEYWTSHHITSTP